MRSDRRQLLLKIIAGAIVGLFLLDRMVISPAMAGWKDQSERIATLKQKVERGNQLLDRAQSIRQRWTHMMSNDLPEDVSAAENEVFKGISRWARDSRVSFTSLTPQWRSHDEGYDTYECRAAATGDQASLARLIYEIETDPLPARVQECELTARDAKGAQLNLSLHFSFVRLNTAVAAPVRSAPARE
ncbi:MAG: hypothetical protein QOD99_2529 [Chthoniobacter sp.]|jgi:uncharacterized protein YukE|nr:hypothetical protein [Chthoniobacter sp.]